MNKIALILGSSGLVGSLVLQTLIHDALYSKIYIINRKASGVSNIKVQEIITDFSNFDFLSKIEKVDSVFSCLGTTQKKTPNRVAYEFIEIEIPRITIDYLLKNSNLSKVHVVSAVGSNLGSRNFYLQLKGKLENLLNQLSIPATYIYRPALIKGQRTNDPRFLEKLAMNIMPLFDALLPKKKLKYHSIDASLIAKAMVYYDQQSLSEKWNVLEYEAMMASINH